MSSKRVRGFDENGLISLIDMTKTAQLGLTKMIRKNFGLITQARESGASWTSIVEALGAGWRGDEKLVRTAYAKERRKQQSRGIVPAKNEKLKIKNEEVSVRESPGSPVTRPGVKLLDGKVSKNGACEVFNSFKSID